MTSEFMLEARCKCYPEASGCLGPPCIEFAPKIALLGYPIVVDDSIGSIEPPTFGQPPIDFGAGPEVQSAKESKISRSVLRDQKRKERWQQLVGNQTGFTLLELLIVVAIIGLLSSFLVPAVLHYLEKAKVARLTGDAHAIMTELEADRIIRGHYVSGLEGLSLGGIGLGAWHYRQAEEIDDPMAPQGARQAAGSFEDSASADSSLSELNPFDEVVYEYWLQVGSLREPVAPRLNKSFGWGTGGGGAFRFAPLFSPATGNPDSSGGGGDVDSNPIPDPCDSLPSGPIPVECR